LKSCSEAKRLVHSDWLIGAGLGLSALGLSAIVWSKSSIGESLRIGVDPSERTALVRSGPFRWVCNPIYSAMLVDVAGVAALIPNAVALVALAVLALATDLPVRMVEEPYLAATHGNSYSSYAVRAGRFIPGISKLSPRSQ
jgi:protein-S-isoprenylcysteine O-methyltransferase Ste14